MSRESALKVLDYAVQGPEGKENCEKFIEILGLRTIFPLFMKTPSKTKRKGHTAEMHEEHVCSIIASLLKNSTSAEFRRRILTKFVEQDYAKLERLLELHFKYLQKVQSWERERRDSRNSPSADFDEDENYLDKLDVGLFTLQLVDYILGELLTADLESTAGIQERVQKIMGLRNGSQKVIGSILKEYAENMGETEEESKSSGKEDGPVSVKRRILDMVNAF